MSTPFGDCPHCKGYGYVPRNPMPKGVKNGVALCSPCHGQGTKEDTRWKAVAGAVLAGEVKSEPVGLLTSASARGAGMQGTAT